MFNLVTISHCEILADVRLALCVICVSLYKTDTYNTAACVFLIVSF